MIKVRKGKIKHPLAFGGGIMVHDPRKRIARLIKEKARGKLREEESSSE